MSLQADGKVFVVAFHHEYGEHKLSFFLIKAIDAVVNIQVLYVQGSQWHKGVKTIDSQSWNYLCLGEALKQRNCNKTI